MRRRPLIGSMTAAAVAAGLVAGCSTSHSNRTLPTAPPAASTTSVPVVTTTTVPFLTYRVRKGDTLSKIANQYRVSAASIIARNHITNPDVLTEGQALRIPPAPPLAFVVTPSTATQGHAFQLKLTGAPPGAQITFEVQSPRATFTGPPHVVAANGTVTASYQTRVGDPTGTFTVVAKGNGSEIRRATFVVTASTPVT